MPLILPSPLLRRIEAIAGANLEAPGSPPLDFTHPPGEPALAPPDSLAWRVFKNPVALFAGGIAAVILELAEPRVRTGVWEHTTFRTDPLGRLRRTGRAAMVTVYAPQPVAARMIAGIVRAHDAVRGHTPAGEPYHANDPTLLRWVQATAAFGFATAYDRYVRPLSPAETDRLLAEGLPAARLYGAPDAPASAAEMAALFAVTRPRLEPSPIVDEFLRIMHAAPILPAALRPAQGLLIRAAVSLVPEEDRRRLHISAAAGLRPWEAPLVRALAALADRLVLPSSPAAQSCRRMGLPSDYLYRGAAQVAPGAGATPSGPHRSGA